MTPTTTTTVPSSTPCTAAALAKPSSLYGHCHTPTSHTQQRHNNDNHLVPPKTPNYRTGNPVPILNYLVYCSVQCTVYSPMVLYCIVPYVPLRTERAQCKLTTCARSADPPPPVIITHNVDVKEVLL